jgi:tRNA 2-thiouridine synthesizing protein A
MPEEYAITKTLDVRGEICPYPDVNSMTTLKQMAKGEILEVLVDYPLSLERIPRNAKKWGHKVLAVEKIDGPEHRIVIEAWGLK